MRKNPTAADLARLPDSAFAYVDSSDLRLLPLADRDQVVAALCRFVQVDFESDAAKQSSTNGTVLA